MAPAALLKGLGFSYVLCHIYQADESSSLGHLKWHLFLFFFFLVIESHPLCHSEDLWNLGASLECCHYAGPIPVGILPGRYPRITNQKE